MRVAQTRVITGMTMPGNWHYMQEFKGSKTKITAGSYEELLAAVQEFRLNNRFVVGDIQTDVDGFICASFPRHCRTVAQAPMTTKIQVPTQSQVRFIDKLVQWALHEQHSGVEFVPFAEAEARGSKCAQCPNNVNGSSGGCGRCDSDAQRLFLIVRQGKDTSHKHKLMACKLHEQDNRTAVWLAKRRPRHANAPSHCWV